MSASHLSLPILFGSLFFAASAAAAPRVLDARVARWAAPIATAAPRAPLVPVFVETSEVEALRAFATEAGGRFGSVRGGVATLRVPAGALPSLAQVTGVTRVEAASRVHPRLDKAVQATSAGRVHAGDELSGTYTGRGVIVGVVDFSFDVGHAMFRSGDRSRVVALWDMGARGTPPRGFDRGALCSAESIEDESCPHRVTSDHGTHVAGIAAGRRVRGTPYVGFAPNADLVFAAFGNSGDEADDINAWFSSSLCDAVRFIFDEAERRGQPAVVNLSLGSHAGPHDGSSLEDRCLDELVGPGRIIVASAGNEGEGSYHSTRDEQVVVHASGELGVAPKRAWFLVPGAEDGGLLEGQLWVNPGAELTARLGVRSAAGVDVTTESVALDGQLDGVTLDVDGAPLGPIALYGDETPSGARALEFAVLDEDGDGAEADLDWFIEVSGAGAMDGFIDTTFGGGFVERAEGFAADSSMTVGFPAVIPNVIAVGAYVTRPTWRAEDGSWYASLDSQTEEPVTLGELCKFSSRGPSRDPARTGLKPDVVAPGEMIVSALARTGGAADPQVLIDSSRNGFIVEAGTSQSSPAIAGIIALQLERDPSLTPEKLRAIWKDAAQVPKGGSAEDWGRGKLDAWRAVSLTPEVNAGHKPKKSDSGCSVAGPQGRNFGWVGVGAAVTGGLLRRRRRPASGLRRAAS